jgi:hypothetical protein
MDNVKQHLVEEVALPQVEGSDESCTATRPIKRANE